MFKPVDPKPDFVESEKKMLKYWYEQGIVEKYLQKNKTSKKYFSFVDGPITANNPMGIHHAWGRTYKDLWQRFFNMRGYRQRFQNGFDAQGLWVEVEVEKELGFRSKKDIEEYGIAKFVNKCKHRVRKFAKIQTEQSKRLGYFMDWDNSYFTMSDENNYMIWHFLKRCHENGWIYKGRDSVPWCPRCETAISQHEMLTEDYKELMHEAIYLGYPIVGAKDEFLLVWTTTPWTLPANIAVAVDRKLDYSLVEGKTGDKFWVAKDLVERVFGKDYQQVVKTVKGKELVGLHYQGPFDHLPVVEKVAKKNPETFHSVVATDERLMPITTEEGTGFVHTAVSAGTEDFKLGQKLGLPMIPVIADNADYLHGLGFLAGKNAKENPLIILDYLVEEDKKAGVNWVFKIEDYTHRYPVCWRCKSELVWKVADEWYIAMDKKASRSSPEASSGSRSKHRELEAQGSWQENTKTLRERMIGVAKSINWIPEFGLDRELDWLKNMHDWLISKKRYWGLALPIYECKTCSKFEVIGGREELEERAVGGWEEFEGNSPHRPWIDKVKIKCSNCNTVIERVKDVGNPWLDAGIVAYSTITQDNKSEPLYKIDKKQWRRWFPAHFITESFPGQFKNWFYSLIAMSTVLENERPFKTVLGFGTLLAEDGEPMHKSAGNMIEFNEGADKIGVDVMRWMYVRHKPENNLLFGYKSADMTRRKFHLLIWNVYRFFVTYADLDRIDKGRIKVDIDKVERKNILDKWIVSRINGSLKNVTKALEKYDAHEASGNIEISLVDFSLWYVRRSRNRVGLGAVDEEDKLQCYQTLYYVLKTLSQMLAPFTPFLSDEIYMNLTGEDSVHLSDWPELDDNLIQEELEKKMNFTQRIIGLGHAVRKKAGIKVRQPLKKLKVKSSKLKAGMQNSKYFKNYEQLIKDELNIKEIDWVEGGGELTVELDTDITPELKVEGDAREIIRQIQSARKKAGCSLNEKVKVILPDWPAEFTRMIKEKTLAEELIQGKKLQILSRET